MSSESPSVSPQTSTGIQSSSSHPTDSPPTTPGLLSSSPSADLGAFIPPTHPARTLVLCFDGTGDQFDNDNSNVVQLFSFLKKDDKREQMAGIGTYTSPQVATPIMSKISKTLDEMVAWNLDAHVMDGYEFLMQNYEAGDKICIFGFSRGAYTARALAGMVHKVGLLPACNHQQVPFAYKMYTRTDEVGWKQSTAFKKAFSADVDIEFIGVWDTVCSVGLIPRRLPFTTSNTSVKTFRHAVSLDERRAKFKANLFNHPTKEESRLGTKEGDMPKSDTIPANTGEGVVTVAEGQNFGVRYNASGNLIENGIVELAQAIDGAAPKQKGKKKKGLKAMEREFSKSDGHNAETDVLEVWFAGCHCDVGGGSVPNDTRHNLARIPLRWMIRQCFLANTGIRFHATLLRTAGINPDSLYPVVQVRPAVLTSLPPDLPPPSMNGRPGTFAQQQQTHARDLTTSTTTSAKTLINYADEQSHSDIGNSGDFNGYSRPLSEEEEDYYDAYSPIYDQLTIAKYWWLLEILPMRHKEQNERNDWIGQWSCNLGQGRKVPKRIQKRNAFNVHRSVKLRMEADGLPEGKYIPKAHWKIEPNWVD
ncbi:hypothetical protein K474DRAFT_1705447 [Panus rudis PR-1116 ss-1]|nr:hypothetical protein K474DRAFT_1705447 [Panus rudis PR-1116 ss-1]